MGTAEVLINPVAVSKRFVGDILRSLGPGLITGASDDDPSGIATYSQVGAQFGYGMLWTMLFSYPLMVATQEICARIGRVTGYGIAGNIRRYYPRWLVFSVVGLVLAANIINLGADIGAMAAAAYLLIPMPRAIYVTVFGLVSLMLQVFVPYTKYVKYLKWLTLALFSYVATALIVKVPWLDVLIRTVRPGVTLNDTYLTALIAVLGTTISPYLFFWQASQEVEEVNSNREEQPLKLEPKQARGQLARIRVDTLTGMAASNAVAFFIILTTAATLHASGQTDVTSAEQAAKALEPLAGKLATWLFAAGIIGTGLLAVPVLAGSAAYGVGEAFRWKPSLEKKPHHAKEFYGVIAAATVIGLSLNFLHFDPIKALFWAAVVNGVVAVPLMIVIMLMGSNWRVMGRFVLPRTLKFFGWLATAVMLITVTCGIYFSFF